MKFTLIKDIKHDAVMRPLIIGFFLFTLLYLMADFFVKQSSIGLLYQSLHTTMFGDEESYIEPLAQGVFLEFWHTEIFITMMLVFTLSALYIRLSEAKKYAIVLVNLLFISAFLALCSLALAFFALPNALYLYVATFFAWHLLAIFMSLYGLFKVLNA
jgi:hypothetical protein